MALVTDLVLAPLVEHLKHVVRDQPGGKQAGAGLVRPNRSAMPRQGEQGVCVGGTA